MENNHAICPLATSNNFASEKRNRIRKRPVHFGNPAFATYTGYVFTLPDENDDDNEIYNRENNYIDYDFHYDKNHNQSKFCENVVAIVGVPPEQVPEDLWNFVGAHISYIRHVRILTLPPTSNKKKGELIQLQKKIDKTLSSSLGSKFEAMNINEKTSCDINESNGNKQSNTFNPQNTMTSDSSTISTTSSSRSYLVLFELDCKESVDEFIADLNGKPFTFLKADIVCKAFRVVPPLIAENGSSLMNPFFSSKGSRTSSDILDTTTSSSKTIHKKLNHSKNSHKKQGGDEKSDGILKSETSETSETQNCAVCLDLLHGFHEDTKLPLNSSNLRSNQLSNHQPILTTVCNHSFHVECLLRWQDSPCPVCRYDHSGMNESLSQCHVCGTTENIYVCLICGVVSCGGPQCNNTSSDSSDLNIATPTQGLGSSHARDHYNSTLHAYAFQTETQYVWDFAGDGYVHRLVSTVSGQPTSIPQQEEQIEERRNRENNPPGLQPTKMVEIYDPRNNNTRGDRSLTPSYVPDAREGEVMHRKLESFASEYYTLLKDQLDQQRQFYEERLKEIKRRAMKKHLSENEPRYMGETTSDLIWALKQERNQLEQRFMSMKTKYKKVSQDVEFLMHMNEGLEENKPAMKREIQMVQRERQDAKDMVLKYLPALEAKVKMLMIQLETRMSDVGKKNDSNNTGVASTVNSNSSLKGKKPSTKRR